MSIQDLEFAKRFAGVMHFRQAYGTHPYTYHLQQVEMITNRFGFNDIKLQICAWLHDIIEDTDISYYQLENDFGKEIADIVYAVTNEMGRNRRERYAKTYPKIRANKNALIIKLADRIANIEFSKGSNTSFVEMYKKEWNDFHGALFDMDETDSRIKKMWQYLESLFSEDDDE